MESSTDRPTSSIGRTLEQEMALVQEAITMVASGASPRVVVGGLHFGEAVLALARPAAIEVGVRIVPLWMPDDAGADIAVERIGDG